MAGGGLSPLDRLRKPVSGGPGGLGEATGRPKKAELNARKHGVAFDEASTIFGDPLALLMPDPDQSLGEERYIVLGMSNQ